MRRWRYGFKENSRFANIIITNIFFMAYTGNYLLISNKKYRDAGIFYSRKSR